MCSYLFHSPLPHCACARGHCPLSCSAAASPLLSPWLSLHCLCLCVHCLPVSCVAPQVTWNTSSSSLPRKGAPYISFCSPRRGSSWLVKTLIPWILWEKKTKTLSSLKLCSNRLCLILQAVNSIPRQRFALFSNPPRRTAGALGTRNAAV